MLDYNSNQTSMYMRGSNNQPDIVQEKLGNLQSEIAELKTELRYIHRQSESRDRWVQAIGSALFVLIVSWIGQNLLDSYSAHKLNPVGISTSKAK